MNSLDKVDKMIVGGGKAYTFQKLRGMEIGTSLYDEAGAAIVPEILAKAERLGVEIVLPKDFIVSSKFGDDGAIRTSPLHAHGHLHLQDQRGRVAVSPIQGPAGPLRGVLRGGRPHLRARGGAPVSLRRLYGEPRAHQEDPGARYRRRLLPHDALRELDSGGVLGAGVNFVETQKPVSLSEQELVDCDKTGPDGDQDARAGCPPTCSSS